MALTKKIEPTKLDLRYFNMMDSGTDNAGVYALFEKSNTYQNISYGKSLQELHHRVDHRDNVYYSPNQFKSWNMSKENILTLNSVFIDIDIEETSQLTPQHKLNVWHMILQETRLPRPSAIIDSGNGMHIYYLLDKAIHDNSQNGTFKSMIERINKVYAEKINQAIENILTIPMYADMIATNSNRLLRLPATANGNKLSHVIELNPNDRHSIADLLEHLPEYDKTKTKQHNQMKYGNQIKFISNVKRLNYNRVKDFHTLAELRDYDLQGQRNEFFHILTSQYMHREIESSVWLSEVYDLNSKLIHPLSDNELNQIIKSSEKGMYLYRNSTLTEKLAITDAEINQLITIRRTSRREEREQAKLKVDERNRKINELYIQNVPKVEIARRLGISRPTVDNNLKK